MKTFLRLPHLKDGGPILISSLEAAMKTINPKNGRWLHFEILRRNDHFVIEIPFPTRQFVGDMDRKEGGKLPPHREFSTLRDAIGWIKFTQSIRFAGEGVTVSVIYRDDDNDTRDQICNLNQSK